MSFDFCSFSSGSDGNCYLVKSENDAVLIDAGVSGKKIWEGLDRTGTDPGMLRALLITHEHSDHVSGLAVLMRKSGGITAYANKKTWDAVAPDTGSVPAGRVRHFNTGDDFTVGDISIKTFSVNHDAAEPVGYTLRREGRQISVVTDTGHVDDRLLAEICDADLLVLESNHDEDMLKCGGYPIFLKRRVLGDEGHLSNAAAGNVILKLLDAKRKKRRVLLAHLSRENNLPELAILTVKNIIGKRDADVRLDTIRRGEIGSLYEI
jgi:phosphoribosyl 1,2-cyclic phosphodiesterase